MVIIKMKILVDQYVHHVILLAKIATAQPQLIVLLVILDFIYINQITHA